MKQLAITWRADIDGDEDMCGRTTKVKVTKRNGKEDIDAEDSDCSKDILHPLK